MVEERALGIRDIKPAARGWLSLQRARLAHKRHPELGEISAYCFYASRLRFRDLAFDIGANHGMHTSRMLNRGARVVAVEPQHELAAQLTQRFPDVTVLPLAVGAEPGQAVLYRFRESDAWASLIPTSVVDRDRHSGSVTAAGSEQVSVTTLDELIYEYGEPVLAKIDTEGFEHLVLQGLSRPLEHILFEVHEALAASARAAFERLDELGRYEYSVTRGDTWQFARGCQPWDEILADLPTDFGNVYARRIR